MKVRKGVRAPAVGRRAGSVWAVEGARALGSVPRPAVLALPCDFSQVRGRLGQAGLEASWEAADRKGGQLQLREMKNVQRGTSYPCGSRGPVGCALCSAPCSVQILWEEVKLL